MNFISRPIQFIDWVSMDDLSHSSTLAWKIPWMEEPGRLQSMGLLRVEHDWATSLSCIGEGNSNPLQCYFLFFSLQCSCLENPRDGGAWWAAVYGVTQSQTRLKRLSSSSNVVWLPENGHKIQNVFLVPWKYYSYRRVLTLNAFLGVLFTYKRKKQGSSMG